MWFYLILFVQYINIDLMKIREILLLLTILQCAVSQEIIDYSHTASLQKTQLDSGKRYEISILSSRLHSQSLQFPGACSRNRDLSTNEIIERDRLPLNNQEQYLNHLKSNMTHFLRLSERIKDHRSYIAQYAKGLSVELEKNPIQADQLEELRQLESSLFKINQSIEEKVQHLEELIFQEINRTKDNGFNQLRLSFELSSYEARLKFLEDFRKDQSKDPKDREFSTKRINEYFTDVIYGFSLENQNLDRLNELLEKFAENSALKLKITNEMRKLQAKNHIISNKEECRIKNIKPINRQNQKHIEQITKKLRRLKKIENQNHEHCEGVSIKLSNQIKKVLKAYNFSHMCAEGLEELKREKFQIEQKLRRLEDQYNSLQYDPNFRRIQLYFNQTRSEKEQFIQRISSFDLNLYFVNNSILADQITSIHQKLRSVRQQLENPPEGDVKPFDHDKVRERIKEINQQQYNYCKIKDQYEQKYRVIDKLIRKYEFKVSQNVARHEQYSRQVSQLNELQKQFEELRSYLIRALE